ncbi:hypothetical protein DFA_08477 [Cavenderia fasciculata]|uniref:Leucine-rich repeat-containing protein n=1 Tax=Cavenderia fasciculata TaxID=261658 RepID=F4Q6A7_CACFS|nr:uncharacterized protein DFA_08477 [Cavenderia fasciculata]EGG17481.1 hypothetical protein DFA_08477 [Cavenderia fasciculata]|eukprot:XP_004355965.1 hypothetical protein DFA_08477 [Cavenderia fasciculata]
MSNSRLESTSTSTSSSSRSSSMTLLSCHISLSNAQQTLPDDERIQYGLLIPQNQSLCLASSPGVTFTCSNQTFDGQYRIVKISASVVTFTNGGSPSSSLTSLTMPALKNIDINANGVANPSINVLELLKSVKSLEEIYFQNDPSIKPLSDFNNFPNLTYFRLSNLYKTPFIVPHGFLNNSIKLEEIHLSSPVTSITIDDSLHFPSLFRYNFHSNCTYGSHHINLTSKSFPKLRSLSVYPYGGSNTTIYLNTNTPNIKMALIIVRLIDR